MPYRPTERTRARHAQTREEVVSAALRLVARGGWPAASVSAVAAGAGVGTGTLYRRFPSKALLLAEVFRRASSREVDAVAAAAAGPGSAVERLAAAIDTFARRALRGRRLAWALVAEPVDPAVEAERLVFRRAYRDVFAGVLEDGIALGELPAQDVQLSAAALVGAIAESLVGPLSPTAATAREPDALVEDLIRFCLRSVSGREPGRRRANTTIEREPAHV